MESYNLWSFVTDIFQQEYFQGSSVFITQISNSLFFLLLNIPFYAYTTFYLSISSVNGYLGCFCFWLLWILLLWNLWLSFCVAVYFLLGKYLRGESLSYMVTVFNCLRHLRLFCILHSHKQYSSYPYPCQNLSADLLILDMKWYLIVVLFLPYDKCYWGTFHVLIVHLYIFR